MSQLESRIERLERSAGMAEVPVWVRDLNDDDRAFYLALKGREAMHPKGFDGLVRTMDEQELIRMIGLLTCAVGDESMLGLDDATRAEVRAIRERYG
jgi:hypothetical protein